jgi:hypothetical protein
MENKFNFRKFRDTFLKIIYTKTFRNTLGEWSKFLTFTNARVWIQLLPFGKNMYSVFNNNVSKKVLHNSHTRLRAQLTVNASVLNVFTKQHYTEC